MDASDIQGAIDKLNTRAVELVKVSRLTADANNLPVKNKIVWSELNNQSTNIPDNQFYHIISIMGDDQGYATQLAIAMTGSDSKRLFFRNKDNYSWKPWHRVATAMDVHLGGWASTNLPTTSFTKVTLNSGMKFSDYNLIAFDSSYYTTGAPSYARAVFSTADLTRFVSESAVLVDGYGGGRSWNIRYVNDTQLSIKPFKTGDATNCLCVRAIM